MCALNSVHMEKKHNQNYIAPFKQSMQTFKNSIRNTIIGVPFLPLGFT